MCGITGVISGVPIDAAAVSTVQRMNQLIIHRGPNSEGMFTSEHAVIAMRRLSIIDLEGGAQPIFNETGDVVIVCNGEIYNHRELRTELEALGHSFSSHSDVETIVHAYEQYGVECLAKLRGMFAFALWDMNKRQLLLARDRLGEKPLYYHRDETGNVWFASELRSVCAALSAPPQLTVEAFNLFLTFQYIPEPVSPVAGVEQLPAGHYWLIKPGEQSSPCAYWDLAQVHADPAQPVKVAEEILDSACRLMGNADVPVAVALSGGIDSSLVAALTAKHFPGQLHAFTIGYEGRPATDERGFAATLAQELGIGFTEVELKTQDVIDGFPDLMAAMDTPIGDIAAFGYYSVCQAAHQAGYPVLLSGTGGDEFFWGYEWVREAVTRNEAVLTEGSAKRGFWQRLFGNKGEPKFDFFGVHPDLRNGDAWSRKLLPAAMRERLPANYWLEQTALDTTRPIHQAVTDLLNRTWLRSNCLALMDRMSMAHSVEVRLPLLDVDLVNRVTGMRNDGLSDWKQPHKWLLVEALRDVLPADVLSRKKQGFTPPVGDWMKGIVKRYSSLIENGALVKQGLIAPEHVKGGLSGFDLPFQYKLVLLECWVRLHFEQMPLA